jgi:shikimate kinase
MSAVLITGCSGAGKSAIATVLARRGLACIDDDEDPFLARFVDPAGAVAEEPAELDFAWLSRHSWEWDPARLDELIQAAPATLYLCGGADNQLELANRFTQVFLLEIDEPTMLARLDTRQDNEWGRAGDSREYIRRLLPGYQDRLRAFGAIPIDARQPLDQVVDVILSRTLANSATSTSKSPTQGSLGDRPGPEPGRSAVTGGMLCCMMRWPGMSVLIVAGLVVAPAAAASGSARPGPGAAGPAGHGRAGLSAASMQALAWSTVPSPNRGANTNILTAVSCASASACAAVGYYNYTSSIGRNLIESWDGTAWSLMPSPQPGTGDELNGVSCLPAAAPPGACVAVGEYSGNGLVESWNGTRWSVVPTPHPRDHHGGLTSVSCTSAAACTAVGFLSRGPSILAESWNGTSWSIEPAPDPGTQSNSLLSVACTAAAACMAVGDLRGVPSGTLAESWNGSAWSVVPTLSPGTNSTLSSVSCVSAAACVAVGSYTNSKGVTRTLIESWNGTSWSQVPAPAPGGTDYLDGVSCVSAAACVTVGYYFTSSKDVYRPLAESWNGSSWSVVPSPSPHPGDNFIFGVSCGSASACTAVGQYLNSRQVQRTLIESGTAGGTRTG